MRMMRSVCALAALMLAGVAHAQNGHFVGAQTCVENPDFSVTCSGTIAGLGSTTFEIVVTAAGDATVQCANPGGNVAPGQDTSIIAGGSSGPQRTDTSGNYSYTVSTNTPTVTARQAGCPNGKWTATITNVNYTDATIVLYEGTGANRTQSDTDTVPVD